MKKQRGDKQIIIAIAIWLIVATILYYFRFKSEFKDMEWHGFILTVVFFHAAIGILMGLSLGLWNLILMILFRNFNPQEVGIFANKEDWKLEEILFHFLFGWPIGCFITYVILKFFGVI